MTHAASVDAASPPSKPLDFRFVALIVASAMFMEQLDATILATALPTMARDFGVAAPSMSIALTSYLLSPDSGEAIAADLEVLLAGLPVQAPLPQAGGVQPESIAG